MPTTTMPKADVYEREILDAFEKGSLPSVATKSELSELKADAKRAAARAAKRQTRAAR